MPRFAYVCDMSRELEHGRRTFLTISAGGVAALLAACGDDSIATSGTDSGTGSTSGSSTSGGPGSTTSPSSTIDPTTQTGSETTDPDGSGSTTDDETTGTDTDEPPVECEDGELIDWDPSGVGLDETIFPLALMSGEMRPESAMFTVYVPDGAPKTFRIWRPGPDEGSVYLVDEITVEPNGDGFVKFTVEGLCPGTWYEYGYFVGDSDDFSARSRIGHIRTAIAEDATEPLVVALASCCGSSLDWPAMGRTNEEYYDVLMHLGDMAYNDGMETLAEYRANWRDWLSTPDYRNVFSNSGMFATWDDHEIDDNSNFDRETMDPAELIRRQNAMDSYFELMPIDAEGPNYRLWRSFRWGLTAEIIVLDCRYERRPSQDVYLSEEQMQFLEDRLLNSPCHFKIVMNSVPITNMPLQWDIAASDRWDGYQAARNRVRDFINNNDLDNVWFVSGDFHCSFLSRLEPQGEDNFSRIREIACASGNENPIPQGLLGFNQPQFDYGVNETRGCILTFDPSDNTVTLRFIHPDSGDDAYFVTMTYGQ